VAQKEQKASAYVSGNKETTAIPYQSQLLASPVAQTYFDTAIEPSNV
jgi:hypothetical protein